MQTRPEPIDPVGQSSTNKRIVIAGRCGRLANRLTLFANFVAWAEEQGYRLFNPTFHSYAHLFEALHQNIYCEYPLPPRPSRLEAFPGLTALIRKTRIFGHIAKALSGLLESGRGFSGRAMTLRESGELVTNLENPELQQRIRAAKLVLVNGWTFRAPTCVKRHRDKVRNFFKPLAIHEKASLGMAQRARGPGEILVGVHIRRGDYANWRNGRYFFPVSRYYEWMQELAGQLPGRKVSFLVCSNEPRSEAEFPGLSVRLSSAAPVEDMYALAECDYIVGPVSSFTQWASFYGNKPLLHLVEVEMAADLKRFAIGSLGEVPH